MAMEMRKGNWWLMPKCLHMWTPVLDKLIKVTQSEQVALATPSNPLLLQVIISNALILVISLVRSKILGKILVQLFFSLLSPQNWLFAKIP